MTPKEKAEELVYRFMQPIDGLHKYPMCFDTAKQCALIAVDEMLDFRNGLYINEGSLAHKYLLDIKQEIEKL